MELFLGVGWELVAPALPGAEILEGPGRIRVRPLEVLDGTPSISNRSCPNRKKGDE